MRPEARVGGRRHEAGCGRGGGEVGDGGSGGGRCCRRRWRRRHGEGWRAGDGGKGGQSSSPMSTLAAALVFFFAAVAAVAGGIEQPPAPRMHTLFSVECNDYFDWQTVGLVHSYRKSRHPGPITRLLSCTAEERRRYCGMDLAPTFEVPSMSRHPRTGD